MRSAASAPLRPVDLFRLNLFTALIVPLQYGSNLRAVSGSQNTDLAFATNQADALGEAGPINALPLQRDNPARKVIEIDLLGTAYWSEGLL